MVDETENIEVASSDMGDPQQNADEHSMRLFGKPYHQLNPAEFRRISNGNG